MDSESKPSINVVTPGGAATNTTSQELISFLRSAIRPKELDKLERVLMDRESNTKRTIRELQLEIQTEKNKNALMEKKHQELVLEKAENKDELAKYKRECDHLSEQVTRLGEDQRAYRDREKRAEERYDKLSQNLAEAENEKKEAILQFSEKDMELMSWKRKFKELEVRVLRLEEDIRILTSGVSQQAGPPMEGNWRPGLAEVIVIDDGDDENPAGHGTASGSSEDNGRSCMESSILASKSKRERDSSHHISEHGGDDDDSPTCKLKMTHFQGLGHDPKPFAVNRFLATSDLGGSDIAQAVPPSWAFEVDMLRAFERDDELCLNAVCALYRQQSSKEKSFKDHTSSSIRGCNQFDAIRVALMATFLIDGDPQGKLRKSVSALQRNDPNAVDECRKLAIRYPRQLFEIYQKKVDPFFHS